MFGVELLYKAGGQRRRELLRQVEIVLNGYHWLRGWGQKRVATFIPTDRQLQISVSRDARRPGAQKFKSAQQVPQNGGFFNSKFCIFESR